MLGTFGLQTYIWNNRLKSLLLLAGFPVLLLLIVFAFALVIAALNNPSFFDGVGDAVALMPRLVPVAIVASLIWFVIAWFANQWIVDTITGATKVERKDEPRLWNILENLCISRGLRVPALRIIETPQLNAFASGIREGRYSITVTRGLIDGLNDAELEAVLGHELTHIRNRDVQLLVVCAVFVGIISLVGDLMIRSPRLIFWGGGGGGGSSGGSSSGGSSGKSRSSSGGGAIFLILFAVAIFLLARLLALALRMAVSRKREYLADAGSVDLTHNADAMISALRKIEGHSRIEAPAQIAEMFLDHPRATGLGGLLATHPPIEARVKALVESAGGHDPGPLEPPTPEEPAKWIFDRQDEPPAEPEAPHGTLPPSPERHGPWDPPQRGPWGPADGR